MHEQQRREMQGLLMELRAAAAAAPKPSSRTSQAEPRKGGWLKGLPRTPKTPEQIQIRRIWEEARSRGLRFSSLEELSAWWAQTQPVPEDQQTAEASAPRRSRAPGRKARNNQPSPRATAPESAEDASPTSPPEE